MRAVGAGRGTENGDERVTASRDGWSGLGVVVEWRSSPRPGSLGVFCRGIQAREFRCRIPGVGTRLPHIARLHKEPGYKVT